MGGFRHRSLHVESKHAFRRTSSLFSQPLPPRITHARRTIAAEAVSDKIHIGVVLVGRPMKLEIVKERRPVRFEVVGFEIAEGERKAMVDAGQRRGILGQSFNQPFGDVLPAPIFSRRLCSRGLRRQHFDWRCVVLGQVYAQALQVRGRCLCSGIVDPDVSRENHFRRRSSSGQRSRMPQRLSALGYL